MANDTVKGVFNLTNTFITTEISVYFNGTGNATTTPVESTWVYWLPGPLICGFGIVCNILNMCVLSQKGLGDSPYIYLKALAFSDLTLLTLSLIYFVTSKSANTFMKAFYNVYLFFVVGNVFFNASVWLIVALTVERMLFVIRPLTTRPSRTKTRLRITGIFLFCAIINVPRLFCFEIIRKGENSFPIGAEFRESDSYYKLAWFHAVIINFVPNLTLIVTNTALIYALHRAGRKRQLLHSNQEEAMQRDQTRLTKTLVAIVIVFFICTIPSAFVDDPIAYSLFGKGRDWIDYIKSPANQTFIYISNLLVFLNSSLNFTLYCAFNKKFRTATKDLFLKFRTAKLRLESWCCFRGSERASYSDSHGTCSTSNTLSTKM